MQAILKYKTLADVPTIDGEWQKRVENNPHLAEYLASWEKITGKLPQLHVQLSRDMAAITQPDILYAVGDPVYIHIYTRPDGTVVYNPVEPRLPKRERATLLKEVERRIALKIDERHIPQSREEHEKILLDLLNKVVSISGNTKITKGKIYVDKNTYEKLRYELYCEKIGVSILEPFVRDPYIEDIHCSGVGPLYVNHKIFGDLEATVAFENGLELDEFVTRLSEIVGKPVSHRNPIVDATLPDGSRINIVFGEDVSRRGSNFTIRKFSKKPLSITQLIKFGTMDTMIAAYLWMLLENGMSIWVSGETASGKTTTLNAMSVFIRPTAKIVSIEDTPEVNIPHPNWAREVVRQSGGDQSEESGVTMFQLLRAALRQRPNYIIVGEIRGKEGSIAFQAMQTGHPVLSTFHAASVAKLIQRLTGHPINIPKTYIDNLNAVIIQSAVHDPNTGKFKRRVLSVNEILGYDPSENRFEFIEVFSWEPSDDTFIFRGLGSSYLLETKIAIMRGIPGHRIREIYDELQLRARILDLMVKAEIFDYAEVWETIKWVYNVGVRTALYKLEKRAALKGAL